MAVNGAGHRCRQIHLQMAQSKSMENNWRSGKETAPGNSRQYLLVKASAKSMELVRRGWVERGAGGREGAVGNGQKRSETARATMRFADDGASSHFSLLSLYPQMEYLLNDSVLMDGARSHIDQIQRPKLVSPSQSLAERNSKKTFTYHYILYLTNDGWRLTDGRILKVRVTRCARAGWLGWNTCTHK